MVRPVVQSSQTSWYRPSSPRRSSEVSQVEVEAATRQHGRQLHDDQEEEAVPVSERAAMFESKRPPPAKGSTPPMKWSPKLQQKQQPSVSAPSASEVLQSARSMLKPAPSSPIVISCSTHHEGTGPASTPKSKGLESDRVDTSGAFEFLTFCLCRPRKVYLR